MSFTPKVISAPIEPVTITPKLAIVPTQKKEFVDRDEEVEYAEALYSFEAGGEGELTIQKGDTIRVFKKIDDGWWIGECQGKGSGMFPSNYVKLINKDSSNLKKSTPSIISNSHNESFSFSKKIESNKSTSSLIDSKKTVDNCNECGCEEFTANVFKQGFCNNCFHRH